MAERLFDGYTAHSTAVAEGSRFTACLVVTPRARGGFPVYYAVCENRSFRSIEHAEQSAAATLDAVLSLEDDGTPVFPEGYIGPMDDKSGDDKGGDDQGEANVGDEDDTTSED